MRSPFEGLTHSRFVVMIRNRIGGDFCENAFGRDGHGHASKSKETLYNKKAFKICKSNINLV